MKNQLTIILLIAALCFQLSQQACTGNRLIYGVNYVCQCRDQFVQMNPYDVNIIMDPIVNDAVGKKIEVTYTIAEKTDATNTAILLDESDCFKTKVQYKQPVDGSLQDLSMATLPYDGAVTTKQQYSNPTIEINYSELPKFCTNLYDNVHNCDVYIHYQAGQNSSPDYNVFELILRFRIQLTTEATGEKPDGSGNDDVITVLPNVSDDLIVTPEIVKIPGKLLQTRNDFQAPASGFVADDVKIGGWLYFRFTIDDTNYSKLYNLVIDKIYFQRVDGSGSPTTDDQINIQTDEYIISYEGNSDKDHNLDTVMQAQVKAAVYQGKFTIHFEAKLVRKRPNQLRRQLEDDEPLQRGGKIVVVEGSTAINVKNELQEDEEVIAQSKDENKTLWIVLISVIAFIAIVAPIVVFVSIHKYRQAKRAAAYAESVQSSQKSEDIKMQQDNTFVKKDAFEINV